MSIAYIALGSNLGDKKENLMKALDILKNKKVKILKVSGFMETRPYGVLDQPDFLNAIVEAEYLGSPEKLLEILLDIEIEMGRKRLRHWGERNIDLDLIMFDDIVLKTKDLTLPHPDMQNREFVLAPLAEIAAKKVHPIFKITIEELLTKLRREAKE